jgi:hypothetical protein
VRQSVEGQPALWSEGEARMPKNRPAKKNQKQSFRDRQAHQKSERQASEAELQRQARTSTIRKSKKKNA